MRFQPVPIFQLTTSRRGRPDRPHGIDDQGTFNSRPHEEVDGTFSVPDESSKTFQLTTSRRGRHRIRINDRYGIHLSTHDLTKRSTLHFHKLFLVHQSFNSRPHEEVDPKPLIAYNIIVLSTHDLTKRSTTQGFRAARYVGVFQLTTSRRGRPDQGYDSFRIIRLSTHDLTKRSTIVDDRFFQSASLSTHDLTKRSTAAGHPPGRLVSPFNSRPHEEVDKANRRSYEKNRDFQLTTSRRGRRAVPSGVSIRSFTFNSRPHEEVD